MCTAVLCIIDADWRTRGNDCNHPVFCQSVLTMIRDGWAADHWTDVTLTTVMQGTHTGLGKLDYY